MIGYGICPHFSGLCSPYNKEARSPIVSQKPYAWATRTPTGYSVEALRASCYCERDALDKAMVLLCSLPAGSYHVPRFGYLILGLGSTLRKGYMVSPQKPQKHGDPRSCYAQGNMESTSTAQLPFKTPQIPSMRDHKALN